MDSFSYKLFIEAKKEKDLEAMEEVYKIYPEDARIKYEYAILLINNDKLDDAKEILLELLKYGTEKDKNMSLMQLGKIELIKNNLEQSKKYFLNLTCSKNLKDNLMGMFYLGKISVLEEDYEEAKLCFNEIIEDENLSDKDKSYTKLELGRLMFLDKNYEEARKIFTNFVKNGNKKEKYNALFELSKLSIFEEKYDTALEELKELVESENIKDKSCGYHSLGKLYGILEEYDKAEKCFRILKKIGSPTDVMYAYRLLILMSIKQNKLDDALNYIIEARRKHMKIPYKDVLYVCKELNVFLKNDGLVLPSYSYLEHQIIEYDPYLAIEIILSKNQEKETGKFNSDIDVYKLFNEIKPYLNSDYKMKNIVSKDRYIIPYFNVGLNGENYLFVETISNTKNILSMYPIENIKLNLNDEIEEQTRKRV